MIFYCFSRLYNRNRSAQFLPAIEKQVMVAVKTVEA